MKSLRWPSVSILSGALCGAAVVLMLGAKAPSGFAPPRVAVVDMSTVFEDYEKKKDSQASLKKKMDAFKNKLKGLEKDYEELKAELRSLDEDSPLYIEKNLRQKEMELRVRQLNATELKSFRGYQLDLLKEINREIGDEIRSYAHAHDLDLVLERQFAAEASAIGWPIVHYAKPELDITQEIAKILNAKYKKKT